jgi:hypothetical protein
MSLQRNYDIFEISADGCPDSSTLNVEFRSWLNIQEMNFLQSICGPTNACSST